MSWWGPIQQCKLDPRSHMRPERSDNVVWCIHISSFSVPLPLLQLHQGYEPTCECRIEPVYRPQWHPTSNDFPSLHGTRVIPSGRLWSALFSLLGSLRAGIPALMNALQRISFSRLCRIKRPGPTLHERQWRPRLSTCTSQWQRWGSHKFSPNLRPTPMRTVSSSRRKPQDVIGSAFSQSPACSDDTAIKRARYIYIYIYIIYIYIYIYINID